MIFNICDDIEKKYILRLAQLEIHWDEIHIYIYLLHFINALRFSHIFFQMMFVLYLKVVSATFLLVCFF